LTRCPIRPSNDKGDFSIDTMMVIATPNTHQPWRVGVIFSQSGVMAVIEETQLRAPLLAIDEIDQAGGVNAREMC
jgi:ABC-type branched-subunit amino acid transport system substrate-binding protein